MKVEVAESAGFCFGVKRAVELVYDTAKHPGKIYTYGPIIHNEEVVKDLSSRGVQVIDETTDLAALPQGKIIIRSHGVGEAIQQKLESAGFEILDATCPFVKKIHRYVSEYAKKGYHIIIIGNPTHPEVQGIQGWCDPGNTTIIQDAQQAENFSTSEKKKLCIVAQTTFNYNKFKDLVEIISEKGYYIDICILNTICSATEERQTEARKLAAKSDLMIVIGGQSSSNTQKLFEICKEECKNTYYIQTLDDLNLASKAGEFGNVGITAGASTPNNIIEEVQKYVRNEL